MKDKMALSAFGSLAANIDAVSALVDRATGRIPGAAYKVCAMLTPMPFVDCFFVRKDTRDIGVIVRGTDAGSGRISLIGGKQGLGLTLKESLLYNIKADLGVGARLVKGTTWRRPLDTLNYLRESRESNGRFPDGVGHDRGKQSTSHVYAVQWASGEFSFGEKTHDIGIEARSFKWINPYATKPSDWAYGGMRESAIFALRELKRGIERGEYRL